MLSEDVVSITAEFSCKISVSGNFPPQHFAKERLYFQWSTEFTKGDSPEAKIDAKGTFSLHSFHSFSFELFFSLCVSLFLFRSFGLMRR
jgi:hypothetical protein